MVFASFIPPELNEIVEINLDEDSHNILNK
jgi:hypothetical protein